MKEILIKLWFEKTEIGHNEFKERVEGLCLHEGDKASFRNHEDGTRSLVLTVKNIPRVLACFFEEFDSDHHITILGE